MAKKAAAKSKAGSSSEKGQKTLSSSVSYKDQKVYCTKCGESFKTYTTLKNHLFKVHIGDLSNAKKFFCDACKKIFKKLGMLKIHLTKFHPNGGSSKEPAETFLKSGICLCCCFSVFFRNVFVFILFKDSNCIHVIFIYFHIKCRKP